MSDKPDLLPLPDWVEALMPPSRAKPEGSPRADHVPEASSEPSAGPFLTPVKSSNIESVGHDGMALWVKFLNGTLYRYPTAGAELHKGLLAAEFAGSYFHKMIKSAHKGERVT